MSKVKLQTSISPASIGTPCWTAPEVIRNEKSNEKADIFSFGVILWELWTLDRPYNLINPVHVMTMVAFRNERLSIPETCDGEYADLIRLCFAENPYERPSADVLTESLEKIIKRLSATAAAAPSQPPNPQQTTVPA
eukprot:TRINITY_DN9704_c0_g1_i2.p1 TRINITY_DN9704_c0_g1~~TRINITY_DN9704_c0_g1_i2.p1  ORF type:complete len:137 (-),score=29.83 TRINITY_DN9704_c0_g1_i2:203-613(-)